MATGQQRYRANPYTEEEITRIFTAVVAWSGNVIAALEHLEAEYPDDVFPRPYTVRHWISGGHYAELYNSIRERGLEIQERDLADRYRGIAAQAIEATELGVKVATDRLASGREKDPAKAAANLATVADKTLRDTMLLEGKPTQITQDRALPEVMRALIDMGVLVPHSSQAQIEEASVQEDDNGAPESEGAA
jgi:hypothetical protein